MRKNVKGEKRENNSVEVLCLFLFFCMISALILINWLDMYTLKIMHISEEIIFWWFLNFDVQRENRF